MLPPQPVDYATYMRTSFVKMQTKPTSPPRHQTDYVNVLNEYFNNMPEANVIRRWTLEELCTQLHGRYADKPAPRLVAAALRTLGFTQHRDWTRAGRNRRYWKPTFFKFEEK
jgi:hypothetical protein